MLVKYYTLQVTISKLLSFYRYISEQYLKCNSTFKIKKDML